MPPTLTFFEQQVLAMLKEITQTLKEIVLKLERLEDNQL